MRQSDVALFLVAITSLAATPPPPKAPTRPVEATESYSRGLVALSQNDWGDAVTLFTRAVRVDPDYWEAQRELGQCLLKLGKPAQAAEHLREALRVRPQAKDVEALLALANERASASEPTRKDPPVVRSAPATPAPELSLGELAKKKGAKPAGSKSYVLSGSGQDSAQQAQESEAERQAPTGLLDTMRVRAEQVLRPRMASVAGAVKNLKSAYRHYADACAGKTTVRTSRGVSSGAGTTTGSVQDAWSGEDVNHYRSESRWDDYWNGVTVLRNEETPQCRVIASDLKSSASEVLGAMDGADDELASPPSVYPGIREEVFARLASELW